MIRSKALKLLTISTNVNSSGASSLKSMVIAKKVNKKISAKNGARSF